MLPFEEPLTTLHGRSHIDISLGLRAVRSQRASVISEVRQVLDRLSIGIAQAEGCLGDRQGLHVQLGGGGRVEAALSVHIHGALRFPLRQGISKLFHSFRAKFGIS